MNLNRRDDAEEFYANRSLRNMDLRGLLCIVTEEFAPHKLQAEFH